MLCQHSTALADVGDVGYVDFKNQKAQIGQLMALGEDHMKALSKLHEDRMRTNAEMMRVIGAACEAGMDSSAPARHASEVSASHGWSHIPRHPGATYPDGDSVYI